MNRTKLLWLGFLSVGLVGAAAAVLTLTNPEILNPLPSRLEPAPAALEITELVTVNLSVRRGDTFSDILARAGADSLTSYEMTTAIGEAFDVRKLRAGKTVSLVRTPSGSVEAVEYIIDPDHKLELSRVGDVYKAEVVDIPGILRVVPVRGILQGSLFESMERTGEKAELAVSMAEIFAWSLDFYRDPRPGDEFSLLVEKKEYLNGQEPTYRRILAAKYVNSGVVYDAFQFPGRDGDLRYFASDGKSLQSAFLRSPLKFSARVSSHFSHRRLHPVLKRYRPHYGTDYAAPTGTPVHTVASGRVSYSGRSGASGNLVKIKHANGFETMYLHLSRRLVRAGQKVAQGQRIGLVGATGRVTGAHLDFRLKKNGRYLNFERLKLPPATKLAGERLEIFQAKRDSLIAMMESGTPGPILAASPAPEAITTDD